jgi:hypothetical protein
VTILLLLRSIVIDDLAKLIEKCLKVPNVKSPTAPHLQLKASVEEVRIMAGENKHIFIRGIDF